MAMNFTQIVTLFATKMASDSDDDDVTEVDETTINPVPVLLLFQLPCSPTLLL